MDKRQLTDELKDEIRATFAALRVAMPGFRARKSQNQMIAFASRVLSQDGFSGACEAPTGVGKSLAYLTAGIPIAQSHKKKLVLATGTVALQEQLIDRDLPAFLGATKHDVKVVLAKGRTRYACVRDLESLASESAGASLLEGDEELEANWNHPPTADEVGLVGRLHVALKSGDWNGDMDKPPENIPDKIRPMMVTSRGGCTGKNCLHYARCPFVLARLELETADVIVANHSLILADLGMSGEDEESFGGVILPSPKDCIYVIDEGHHLADRAQQVGAATLALGAVSKRGAKLRSYIRASYTALKRDKIGRLTIHEGTGLLNELEKDLTAFASQIGSQWVPTSHGSDEPMWLAPGGVIPEDWRLHAMGLHRQSKRISAWLTSIHTILAEDAGLSVGSKATLPREIGADLERMQNQVDLWGAWAEVQKGDCPPVARWITLTPTDSSLVLHSSSVSAAEFLSKRFFSQAGAVLLTSATLGNFNTLRMMTGLPDEADTVSLPSPFNLFEQGTLRIPATLTAANQREEHAAEIAQWLESDLDWDAGNLVIFTSKAKMIMALDRLPEKLRAICRVQGSAPKGKLIQEHTEDINEGFGSTLVGLASFGEGLDLPGKLCTTVVVTNLPFAPPTDPVLATYCKWLENSGRRPFDEVSVPEATRVLIQYIGRLIRHEDDKGQVVILDRRIASKSYGKTILKALPPMRQVIEPMPSATSR